MKNTLFAAGAACVALLVAVAPAQAEHHEKDGMPSEAEMKKMMELSTPGAEHKVLDPMAGNWKFTVTHKMAPDAPEQTSTGTSTNKWVMDGRFMQQNVTGVMDMGGKSQKYNGMGLIGYNKMTDKYETMWVDNMTTGMMKATATYDQASKTLKETGTYSCPMKGKEMGFTSEMTFVDKDHMNYVMYDKSMSGEPYKMMEIKYTRQ